jgi:hypothetical protein
MNTCETCYTSSLLQSMQFCRNAQSLNISGLRLSGPSGSVWSRKAEDAMRSTWKLKCFLVGIGLMGISYCVLHISGVYDQSLALTVFTLLTFWFIYILWCNHQKQQHLNQVRSIVSTTSTGMQYCNHHLKRYAVL